MIVLHGTWKPAASITEQGQFFMWGEDSSKPLKRRGRPPKIASGEARTHIFQATDKDLLNIIESLDLEYGTGIYEKAHSADATFLLPSFSKYPQPSPDMLVEDESGNNEESAQMAYWKINGLCIPPQHAVLLFSSFTGAWMETDGYTIGTDLRYWSKASKFAMELLSKQHFIPSLIASDTKKGEAYARWQYVLSEDEERTHMSMLSRSMPPVCTSFVENIPVSCKALLSDYLNAAIDNCVRNWIPLSEMNLKTITKSKKTGLSEAWLKSLATGEPIKAPTSKLKNLSEGLLSWKSPIDEIEKSDFRTCFRLEPPQNNDMQMEDDEIEDEYVSENACHIADENVGVESDTWTLHYFLQALDDPSLLAPAEYVWNESGSTLQYLNRKFDHPQEKLLTDLGKASQLFPPIEDSLNSARPESVYLTTQQAYTFLKEAAPLLTDSGFGVLAPSWWSKGTAKSQLGMKLNLKPKGDPKAGTSIFNFNSIIDYDWQIALGGESISEEEFEYLANLKMPLVRIRGQWMEIGDEEIKAALKLFKSRRSGEMRLSEAVRLGIAEFNPQSGLPISYSASGWISQVFDRLSGNAGITELPQPDEFVGELRPYQVKGFSWLAFMRQYGLGACLADDMGLGKTIQMIALLLQDKKNGVDKPSLMVCPTSVVGNWYREAMRFAPSLRVLVHHGINRRKEMEFLTQVSEYDLVISTYGLVHRDIDTLTQVEWNAVTLDEAQNIKNRLTKQSLAVRKLDAGYRVALTGTPVENRLSELWSIMEFLNAGYLGSADGFHRNFALPIERYNDKEAGIRLRNTVQPFILRRLKTDPTIIKDLPDKIETKVHCNITKEQATLYEAVVKDMLHKIENSEGIDRKGMVFSALVRLKQLCNHPAQYLGDGSALRGRSGKLNRITEMMEEVLAEGDSALVFTQFAEMGKILKKHLQEEFGQEVLFLHGGVSQKKRDEMVSRFSEEGGPRIFILSLKAGGVGLNLTRANHVFHFDRWWNPAVENQATDRAFRIGQTKNVQVHKFICDGTLEERIDEMIESKKALAENVIGTGEGWLTEMSTEQLRDMFTLRRKAVFDE
ncbi:MAG: DEAD/DEAH box helicase [Methanosarcinaceae archaeon]|nr:DEAD/DEAH box helicase [Methanosarcinaceae archaeon]